MKQKREMNVIYKSDDFNRVRNLSSKNRNVLFEYDNCNKRISPILTFKVNGITYTKWNPEYIEYLKKKNPNISRTQIARCIEEAMDSLDRDKCIVKSRRIK